MMRQNIHFVLILLTIFVMTGFFLISCSNPIAPETVVEPAISYSTQAVKLDRQTLDKIVSIDSLGHIIFSNIGEEFSLVPGNIIASGPTAVAPNGFLKKIETIQVSGDQVSISTANATLEEVFEEAYIDFQKDLTINDLETSDLSKGILLKNTATDGAIYLEMKNVILYDGDNDPATTFDQCLANGSIEMNPSCHLKLKIKSSSLEELNFVMAATKTEELTIISSTGLAYEAKIKIGEFNFKCFTIWIGWVPLVFKPVLSIYVGANFNAKTQVVTGVTQTLTLSTGVEYQHGHWNPYSTFSSDFDYIPPTVSPEMSIKGYAGPRFSLLLYGLAGPFVDLDGFLEIITEPLQDQSWKLYGGVEAGIGVELVFLKKTIADYYYPVIYHRKLLTQSDLSYKITNN